MSDSDEGEELSSRDIGRVLANVAKTLKEVADRSAKHQESMDSLSNRVSAVESSNSSSGSDGVEYGASEERGIRSQDPISAKKERNGDYKVYPVSIACKIYQSAFANAHCKKVGDGSFFDAKRTWRRVLRDFPITKIAERWLMPYSFEKDARRVYEEMGSRHIDVSADALWELLEVRLCSATHRAALQDKFFGMKWHERRESVG